MSLSIVVNYDNAAEFTFDDTLLGISDGVVSLILSPHTGQTFTPSFASSTGFTFDSAKTEFVGGAVRQKAQTFEATLVSGVGVNIVANAMTRTVGGSGWGQSGAISSEQIASGDGYVSFKAGQTTDNFVAGLSATDPEGDYTAIDFGFFCGPAGALNIRESGIAQGPTGTYTTSDVLSVAIEAGVVNYYKNGSLFYTSLDAPTYPIFYAGAIFNDGASITDINIKDGFEFVADTVVFPVLTYAGLGNILQYTSFAATSLNVPKFTVNGRYFNGAWVISDGTYAQANTAAEINTNLVTRAVNNAVTLRVIWADGDDQMSLSAVTFGYTGQFYSTANPTIRPNSAFTADGILIDFIETASMAGSDAIKWIIQVSGTKYYWSGTAWVVSDGTYAQSNLASDIADNIETFPEVTAGSPLIPIAFIHSATGATTPSIETLEINFTFNPTPPDEPSQCVVFGFLDDIAGNPLTSSNQAKLIITNDTSYFYGEDFIGSGTIEVAANSEGYVEISLIEGATYAKPYTFTITWNDSTGVAQSYSLGSKTVPNMAFKSLADL